MKKILSVILAFSLLFSLSACGKNDLKEDKNTGNENQTAEINQNESDATENTQGDTTEVLENDKITITPDIKNLKLSFRNSNDTVTNVEKTYSEDKKAKYEDYTNENITEKTITFLGKEFENVPYSKSRKNPYKNRDFDTFANKDITVNITKSGEIQSFSSKTPLKLFSNESENSVELAKKYLNAIMPDFKYDTVDELKINYTDYTWYGFYKIINGIPTSESVTISLNSKGELNFFSAYDVGMYDNVEIKGLDKDVYLKKVDEFIKSTYGDWITDYRIGEDGPFYEMYSDNKLELLIPVEIDYITTDGNTITFGEYVALELN